MSCSEDSIKIESKIHLDQAYHPTIDLAIYCKRDSKLQTSDTKSSRSFTSFDTDASYPHPQYRRNEIKRKCRDILCPRKKDVPIWQQILQEDAEMYNLYAQKKEKKEYLITPPASEMYLKEKILNTLIPATAYSLSIARRKKMYKDYKQVFNGVDSISEFLLNLRHACHLDDWQPAYFYFQYKWYTFERPIYPMHWVLTRDQAATIIQSWAKRYWVQKQIPELIEFWKAIKAENWKPQPYEERVETEIPAAIRDEYKLF